MVTKRGMAELRNLLYLLVLEEQEEETRPQQRCAASYKCSSEFIVAPAYVCITYICHSHSDKKFSYGLNLYIFLTEPEYL